MATRYKDTGGGFLLEEREKEMLTPIVLHADSPIFNLNPPRSVKHALKHSSSLGCSTISVLYVVTIARAHKIINS
jgi:hypothetical protein